MNPHRLPGQVVRPVLILLTCIASHGSNSYSLFYTRLDNDVVDSGMRASNHKRISADPYSKDYHLFSEFSRLIVGHLL